MTASRAQATHDPTRPEPRPARFRGAGGITLVADDWGAPRDPTVLLLHGGGQTRHAWRATAPTLAAERWRVIALDLRGHGDSEWPGADGYEIDHFAEDLIGVIDQLGHPPVLVGASLGGIMGLTAQLRADHQLYAAVALVDIAPQMEPAGVERVVGFMLEHPDGFATLDDAADAVAAYLPHRRRPTSTDGLRRTLIEGDDGRWRWRWDPRFLTSKPEFRSGDRQAIHRRTDDMREALTEAARRLTVPTLLIRGAMSDVVSPDSVKHFLDAVPHATYVDVAEASHMVAGDRNDIFTAALVDFLASDTVRSRTRP